MQRFPPGRLIAAELPAIDVYPIGGPSNVTGQGYLKNLPPGFAPDTLVLLFHSDPPHLNSVVANDDLSQRVDDPASPYPKDRPHFETGGILDLGHRMADKMHAALDKKR